VEQDCSGDVALGIAPVDGERVRRSDLGWALPALLLCVGSIWQVREFVTDDAAISLRYSYHLASGQGIRWNPGEDAVEGYTNFLHVLLGAGALTTGLPALTALRILNQASAVALCAIVYLLGLSTLRSRAWALVAALLCAVHAPLAYWASSGLETGLYAALVYGGLLVWLRVGPGSPWPALPFLLAALTRFEGPVIVAAIGAALLAEATYRRDLTKVKRDLVWVAAFVLVYAGYFGWRLAYFGYPLPNTAYCKQSADDGLVLIEEFAENCGHLLVLAVFARHRALGTFGLVLVALVAAHIVGFRNVAPSVSYFHRFFLPVVPALALLAASGLQRCWLTSVRGRPAVFRTIAVALGVAALAAEVLHPKSGWQQTRATLERLNRRIESRSEVAAWIATHVPSTEQVLLGDVGVVGYVLPHSIADLFGLNDERFPHRFKRSRRKYAEQLLHQRPAIVVIVSKSNDALDPHYATERRIVRDAQFSSRYALQTSVRSPVEPYHYWIYARRDLTTKQVAPRMDIDPARSLSVQVDALSQHVRTAMGSEGRTSGAL
jgi:arabinofuranosyltransferase